ncbi:hypothetical protein [Funiculus sociatus]|uniref:hypothetical protein n=1 Tax=Funiculus sociatus TaxID=450527 RepID=UPI00199A50E3|nr:hypothetical protein [Trichocoleus sp. FACHB-69]
MLLLHNGCTWLYLAISQASTLACIQLQCCCRRHNGYATIALTSDSYRLNQYSLIIISRTEFK